MPEHFSCLGISLNRLRPYVAAAGIATGLLLGSSGVCVAQADALDQGKDRTFSEYAYVANNMYGNDFSGYKIHKFTGELTQLPGSQLPAARTRAWSWIQAISSSTLSVQFPALTDFPLTQRPGS
jgi:hypothetical protein